MNAKKVNAMVHMGKKLQFWPLARLKPYDKNPRTHSPEQIDKLAGLILEFGFTRPVLVDEKGGILAGHGAMKAAEKLGMPKVPVVELTHLTPAQKRAYIIADNQVGLESDWDEDLLRGELQALAAEHGDLSTTGLGQEELDRLLAEVEGDGAVEGGGEGRGGGMGVPVISYNIIFESADQQALWFSFVKFLKLKHPGETLGARIAHFVKKGGYGKS
jgi:hypothetical protein